MTLVFAALGLAIWIYLVFGHGQFWQTRRYNDLAPQPASAVWPPIVAVVPAFVDPQPERVLRDPRKLDLIDDKGDVRPLAEIEEHVIRFAMDHYRNHMTEMARKLGIGRSTLYRKLKEMGLGECEEPAGADAA